MTDPTGRGGRATIEDVAAAAGVSVATVSRALRDLPNVASSTKQRVTEAALSLNYRADPSARHLASGRSRNVEIAVPVLNSWYFSEVLAGAEAVLSECGYSLSISAVPTPTARFDFVRNAVASRHADGLIMVDLPLADLEIDMLENSNLGVFTIGFKCPSFHSVLVDNLAIGRIATEHLFDRGHRRIGILTGQPNDSLRFTVPKDRAEGYRQMLTSHGLVADPGLSCSGHFSVDGGREAMNQLLKLDDPPTAVFALSDEMAFGAMAATRDCGLTTPDDVAIMGVDGHYLAEITGLTTIDQHVGQQGVVAARQLVALLDGAVEPARQIEIESNLIVRGST